MDSVSLVLFVSILLQAAVAVLAIRLIILTHTATAWLLLSVAFTLMTLRRLISFLSQQGVVDLVGPWNRLLHPEGVALAVSMLQLAGVLFIRKIFIERNRTESALRESEERYALAAQGSNEGLWDWNLKTGEVFYSSRWKSILGYDEEDVCDTIDDCLSKVHPLDYDRTKQAINDHIEGKSPYFAVEHRIQRKDGCYIWVLNRGMAVRDEQGVATRLAGSQTDISDRKAVEQQLYYDATHDPLTSMLNRTSFIAKLAAFVRVAQTGKGRMFAVLFIDLDRFKILNDSRGHNVGDKMLATTAKRIQSCLQEGDSVARLGGDEFAVLITSADDEQAVLETVNHMLDEVATPMILDGQTAFTTASIGVVFSSPEYISGEHMLRDADTAMYRAKEEGKASFKVFDSDMHDHAVHMMQLETDMRKALENDEFEIYYQPIHNLKSRKVTGLEALLRWNHPVKGLIMPDEFIAMAEETGLIIPIGNQVIKKVCQQYKVWQADGIPVRDMKININISSKQFSSKDFLDQVLAVTSAESLVSDFIVLEITETALIENVDFANENLSRLRSAGIQVYMDDFGTGYSSLSYLHRFQIDGLKIDRSFVTNMYRQHENMEIIKTIISLAHSLKMKITAEGIETDEQLLGLGSLRCEFGQGFYLSEPMPASEVSAALENAA